MVALYLPIYLSMYPFSLLGSLLSVMYSSTLCGAGGGCGVVGAGADAAGAGAGGAGAGCGAE